MKHSTTTERKRKGIEQLAAILVWLVLWGIGSALIGQEMILASPAAVGKRLLFLFPQKMFWQSIGASLSNVLLGFFIGYCLGVLLGWLAYRIRGVEVLLHPMVGAVKAAPVASYSILLLLLFSSRTISLLISLLVSFPIVYTNILNGLNSMDPKLLEMAEVYGVSRWKKIRYLYVSQLLPFLMTSFSLGLSTSWKAGVAGEVIGISPGTIGEHLYQAKIFSDMPSVLAWTVVVIGISLVLEKLLLYGLKRLVHQLERR